jgi:hypothetical protein
MNSGLTVTCISADKKKPTFQSFQKFGNKYWDDTATNKSQIGYYFAYYFQKKYVYLHKIINILSPRERPTDMDWSSDRNILCLSPILKEFTWEEWIYGVGLGSPYTPDYRTNQTCSNSYNELCNSFSQFNFNALIKLISFSKDSNHVKSGTIEHPITLVIKDNKNIFIEEVIDDEEEIKREMETRILEIKKETEIKLKNAKKLKIRNNIMSFREERIHKLELDNSELEQKISELNTIKSINIKKINDIIIGKYDEEIVLAETDQMNSCL